MCRHWHPKRRYAVRCSLIRLARRRLNRANQNHLRILLHWPSGLICVLLLVPERSWRELEQPLRQRLDMEAPVALPAQLPSDEGPPEGIAQSVPTGLELADVVDEGLAPATPVQPLRALVPSAVFVGDQFVPILPGASSSSPILPDYFATSSA